MKHGDGGCLMGWSMWYCISKFLCSASLIMIVIDVSASFQSVHKPRMGTETGPGYTLNSALLVDSEPGEDG